MCVCYKCAYVWIHESNTLLSQLENWGNTMTNRVHANWANSHQEIFTKASCSNIYLWPIGQNCVTPSLYTKTETGKGKVGCSLSISVFVWACCYPKWNQSFITKEKGEKGFWLRVDGQSCNTYCLSPIAPNKLRCYKEKYEPKVLLGSSPYYFSHGDLGKDWEGKNMRLHLLTRTWGTLQWCTGVFLWMVFNQFVCLYFLSPTSSLSPTWKQKAFCFQDHIQHSFLCIVCGHGHWEGQTTQVGFLGSSIQSQPTSRWGDVVREEEAERRNHPNKPAQIRRRAVWCFISPSQLPTHISWPASTIRASYSLHKFII